MFSYRGSSAIERAKNDRFRAKREEPYGLKRERIEVEGEDYCMHIGVKKKNTSTG